MNPRVGLPVGFASMLGGVFLLAFTQVREVFIDPRRTELTGATSDPVGNLAWVLFSAILLGLGLCVCLASASHAKSWSRVLSLLGVFASSVLLLLLHLTLFINSITIGTETTLQTHFTASHLFHTGDLYSVIAVFVILLLTLGLLALLVACIGALVAPGRLSRALFHPTDWPKNEASLVCSGLLLVFSLTVFLVFLVQTASKLQADPPAPTSFFANMLGVFYYLQIFFVGALILAVAARVFLVNWGTQTPMSVDTVRDSLNNVGRLERVLAIAAFVFNILILAGPAASGNEGLSEDPVFNLNSRGLAWFFFLLVIPYAPYVISVLRLRRMLYAEAYRPTGSPFSQESLRVTLASLGGLVLVAAIGLGARWSPLGLMIGLSSWMTLVLLVASVRFRLENGSFAPHLRDKASPPYFFGFLILSLGTGLMMWGAGNTFVATYVENGQALSIDNASPYGADILFRVSAAALLAFTCLLPFGILKTQRGIKRSLLVPFVLGFTSLVVLATVVFTVGVWNTGTSEGADALAGFAFHQYYQEEKLMVAGLVLVLGGALLWCFSRIVGAVVRPRSYVPVIASVEVR